MGSLLLPLALLLLVLSLPSPTLKYFCKKIASTSENAVINDEGPGLKYAAKNPQVLTFSVITKINLSLKF